MHKDLVLFDLGIEKLSLSCSNVASTKVSIIGNGKISIGQALLRSVKSMQTSGFPFFF